MKTNIELFIFGRLVSVGIGPYFRFYRVLKSENFARGVVFQFTLVFNIDTPYTFTLKRNLCSYSPINPINNFL